MSSLGGVQRFFQGAEEVIILGRSEDMYTIADSASQKVQFRNSPANSWSDIATVSSGLTSSWDSPSSLEQVWLMQDLGWYGITGQSSMSVIAETSSSTGFRGTFESGALVALCVFLFQDQKTHVGAIPDDTWHLSGPIVVLIGLSCTIMKEMWRFVQVNMNYLCSWLLATLKIFVVWLMMMLWESWFARHSLAPTFS